MATREFKPAFIQSIGTRFYRNSMALSPSSETDSWSATQETSQHLLNPIFHYHVHKNSTLIDILTQIKPAIGRHLTSVASTLILFSHYFLVFTVVSFCISHHNPIRIPLDSMRATCPDLIVLIILGEDYKL
jgi:hypothetical protein